MIKHSNGNSKNYEAFIMTGDTMLKLTNDESHVYTPACKKPRQACHSDLGSDCVGASLAKPKNSIANKDSEDSEVNQHWQSHTYCCSKRCEGSNSSSAHCEAMESKETVARVELLDASKAANLCQSIERTSEHLTNICGDELCVHNNCMHSSTIEQQNALEKPTKFRTKTTRNEESEQNSLVALREQQKNSCQQKTQISANRTGNSKLLYSNKNNENNNNYSKTIQTSKCPANIEEETIYETTTSAKQINNTISNSHTITTTNQATHANIGAGHISIITTGKTTPTISPASLSLTHTVDDCTTPCRDSASKTATAYANEQPSPSNGTSNHHRQQDDILTSDDTYAKQPPTGAKFGANIASLLASNKQHSTNTRSELNDDDTCKQQTPILVNSTNAVSQHNLNNRNQSAATYTNNHHTQNTNHNFQKQAFGKRSLRSSLRASTRRLISRLVQNTSNVDKNIAASNISSNTNCHQSTITIIQNKSLTDKQKQLNNMDSVKIDNHSTAAVDPTIGAGNYKQYLSKLYSNCHADSAYQGAGIEFKSGILNRKRLCDCNGRVSFKGRRSWKRTFVTIKDLLMIKHPLSSITDENLVNNNTDRIKVEKSLNLNPSGDAHLAGSVPSTPRKAFNSNTTTQLSSTIAGNTQMHTKKGNLMKLNHAFAKKSQTYTKRPHVFHVLLADKSEFLFEASSDEEMNSWIESINFAAACLSPPPTDTIKRQAVSLSKGITQQQTKMSYWEQLVDHDERLQRLKTELETRLKKGPGEDKKVGKRERVQFNEGIAFIESEVSRVVCLLTYHSSSNNQIGNLLTHSFLKNRSNVTIFM